MKLIDYKICNSDKVYEGYLTPRMMCAGYLQGGKDACQVSRGGTRSPPGRVAWDRQGCPLFPHTGVPWLGDRGGISRPLPSPLCPPPMPG